MKFKLAYIFVAYELVSFVSEMYNRKATSIRFELQEKIGKVNLYIDDVSFKQIDGSIAWKIVKSMYSYVASKAQKDKDFDKDEDVEITMDAEDLKNFSVNFLPLPKGKCLRYSYVKKPAGIYAVSFSFVSNDLDSFIKERVTDIQSTSKTHNLVYEFEENGELCLLNFEAISLKKDKIRLFLEDEDENSTSIEFMIEDFNNKNEVKELFERFKVKSENGEKPQPVNANNDLEHKDNTDSIHW